MLRINNLAGFAGGLPGAASYDIALSAGTAAVNLRTLANAAGYAGEDGATLTFTLASGTMVSSSPSSPTITRGSFGAGCTVLLVNNGTISGAGGAGGAGGFGSDDDCSPAAQVGNTGGTGGTAIDASAGALSIDNQGTIGGGQGGQGGQGGHGAEASGWGGAFSRSATGAAGTAGAGSTGATGTSGNSDFCSGAAGGAGGTAGKYAAGNSNITWVNNGTRLGGVS